MEAENERRVNEAGAANVEAAPPLFSAFRAQPPDPVSAGPRPEPAAEEKSSAAAALEARLAGLEKKLQEAAEKEKARGSEKEMLDFLKAKTGELEEKLRDSQEKALAFAYELKGREEARKESRRETENLLAEVKRQQEAAETAQQQAIELKKSRERIETLEARLTELTSKPPAPPDAGLVARIEELAGKINAVSARLDAAAALPARLAGLDEEIKAVSKNLKNVVGHIEAVSVCLEKRISGQAEDVSVRINAVSARFEAVVKAGLPDEEIAKLRAFFKEDIAAALGPLSGELEKRLLAASEKNLDARMQNEFSEVKQAGEELRLLVNSMEKSAAALAEILSGRLGEVREAVRLLSSETAAAGKGAEKAVEWLKGVMKEKGRAAADPIAGSYDLGFIQASLDNLEKCLSSALDTLARAQGGGEIPPGSPEMRVELLMSRHSAALELSVRSLKDGLAAFHAIRPELLRSVKKNLTGD